MNRRRQAKDQLREQITSVALGLFSARGFDAVTVDQVAESSGVSPMTVFRHFGTKADIVLGDRQAAALTLLGLAQACPADADPRKRVVHALTRFSAEMRHDVTLSQLRSQIVAESPSLQGLAAAGRLDVERALVTGLVDTAPPSQAAATEVASVAGMAVFHRALERTHRSADEPFDDAIARALALLWPDIAGG